MAKRTIFAPVLILLGVYLILNQGGSLGPVRSLRPSGPRYS